jgi:ferrous iron transport protein B
MKTFFTFALAGNPNAGKTTMFNAITGSRQRVGNYPGITVERREGQAEIETHKLTIVDLPGTYSLTPYTQEELVARNYLVQEKPHAVINIVDATSLERNLYLTVQFMELGVPVVIALNMMDAVEKQGRTIDMEKLSALMKCPVVGTVARTGKGKKELLQTAVEFAQKKTKWESVKVSYGPDLNPVIVEMEKLINKTGFLTDNYPARWIAVKYLESDIEVINEGEHADKSVSQKLSEMVRDITEHLKKTLEIGPEAVIADYRYGFIASLVKQGVITATTSSERIELSDRIDKVLTNRLFGPVFMIAAFYLIFLATFSLGEVPMGWLELFFEWLGGTVSGLIPQGLVQSMVVDGIIGGVGGVLGFVPLIMIMFFMIAFLEDSGYMARMAYMMDRIMRIFGLHGSSVMPFIISGGIAGGCAVPGVMAARTLRSPREKIATILTAPFMSCGAKVPVVILFASAFFSNSATVMFFTVLGGWVSALLVAKLLRSTLIKGESTPFVMELPPYRLPTLAGLCIHTWERSWEYIRKAGTVILGVSILIWAAMTFPGLPDQKLTEYQNLRVTAEKQFTGKTLSNELKKIDNIERKASLENSVAGKIGHGVEAITKYAGFNWQTNIALIGGFAAKEVIVSTLGTAYSMGEAEHDNAEGFSRKLAADPDWNTLKAVSVLIFVLLYAPCFVTVVVIAKELSWKWAAFSVVFNTSWAFMLSTFVYQTGSLFM